MPHFFISYAKKDTRELALRLEAALNALPDVTAWVDKSLRAGRSWELQIQTEIDRCDYMIVLYSPDLNRHKRGQEESYVLTEISYAKYTAHKSIIPVMAQKTDAPLSLTTVHYIDFTLSGLRLDDLIAAICNETGILVGAEFIPPASSAPTRPTSLDFMPTSLAWIDIPGTMGKTWKGAPYSIAKYPITNAQFAKFIEADGYNNRQWWTDAGWEAKLKGSEWDGQQVKWIETNTLWNQPRYWTAPNWNGAQQPVVGISWYESVAFCLWLSDFTGEKIMLPTEDQWQYAAQGDDGRDYPWGKEWDASRCNSAIDRNLKTTPVRQYEGKGDSPFGVVDMAGNIWEWCLTDYDTKTNDYNSTAKNRVLRGGSWFNGTTELFRCDCRDHNSPNGWYFSFGFRISRS